MDALEYNCGSEASITRASTLRSFGGQIIGTPEPAEKVSYAIPGTKTEMLPRMIDRTQISLARLAKEWIRAPTIIRGSPTVTHPCAA